MVEYKVSPVITSEINPAIAEANPRLTEPKGRRVCTNSKSRMISPNAKIEFRKTTTKISGQKLPFNNELDCIEPDFFSAFFKNEIEMADKKIVSIIETYIEIPSGLFACRLMLSNENSI
jgi:hypothetical protein